jgi:ribonuclease PH
MNDKHCVAKCGITDSSGIIGSSYLEYGHSKVCVYVFTPRPMTKSIDFDKGILDCEVHLAAHLVNSEEDVFGAKFHAEGIQGVLLRLARANIDALTPAVRLSCYPKTVIMLIVLILDSSSDDQVAVINASSLALCHAAVEMRDLVTANSLKVSFPVNSSSSGSSSIEEDENGRRRKSDVCCNLACLSNLGEITFIEFQGKCDPRNSMALIETMRKNCSSIREQLKEIIVQGEQ